MRKPKIISPHSFMVGIVSGPTVPVITSLAQFAVLQNYAERVPLPMDIDTTQ